MKALLIFFAVAFASHVQAQQVTNQAEEKSRRVLLVYMPDRDVSYWRGGIPFRVNRTIFPVEDTTSRMELAGLDFSKLVLDNFFSAFSKAYPEVTFVPAYDLVEKLAPPPSRFPGPIGYRSDQADSILKDQMAATNTGSVLLIVTLAHGDGDRPNPLGGFGVFTAGIPDGEATRRFKRWRALIRWQASVTALDSKLSFKDHSGTGFVTAGTAYTSEKSEKFNMLPEFEGDESELSAMIRETRRQEILDVIAKLVASASKESVRSFAAAMERSRERSPSHWNLPYLPGIDMQGRSGDRSQQ